MSGITIISRSKTGDAAIRQNIAEVKNAKLKDRLLFRQACRMEVVNNDPLSLSIMGKFRYMTGHVIEPIAADMMTQNGAKPGTDYIIKMVDDDV